MFVTVSTGLYTVRVRLVSFTTVVSYSEIVEVTVLVTGTSVVVHNVGETVFVNVVGFSTVIHVVGEVVVLDVTGFSITVHAVGRAVLVEVTVSFPHFMVLAGSIVYVSIGAETSPNGNCSGQSLNNPRGLTHELSQKWYDRTTSVGCSLAAVEL